jgi:hypothetical protein
MTPFVGLPKGPQHFLSLGMCTKTSNTEAIVFGKDFTPGTLRVNDQCIQISKNIKVLRILLSYNLSWSQHVEKSFLHRTTTHGSAVWMGSMTTSDEWNSSGQGMLISRVDVARVVSL